ncbi:MAG: GNAT family N-acetyltransferase [Anaerolineae bacterium]|nr:GNAT family N-acetyltransferase [Anaerolineae bacterium]
MRHLDLAPRRPRRWDLSRHNLPTHRRRGLGKALTLAAMQSAREAGYKQSILFATPSGFPIYQQLGFETITTADGFVWSGVERNT